MTAVKPIYNRSLSCYTLSIVRDANPLLAHDGYFVYDNAAKALEAIQAGALLSHWSKAKREAVVAFLENN